MNATKTQRDCPQPPACSLRPAASALGPPGSTADRSVHAFLEHAPVSKNRATQAVPVLLLPPFSRGSRLPLGFPTSSVSQVETG